MGSFELPRQIARGHMHRHLTHLYQGSGGEVWGEFERELMLGKVQAILGDVQREKGRSRYQLPTLPSPDSCPGVSSDISQLKS